MGISAADIYSWAVCYPSLNHKPYKKTELSTSGKLRLLSNRMY